MAVLTIEFFLVIYLSEELITFSILIFKNRLLEIRCFIYDSSLFILVKDDFIHNRNFLKYWLLIIYKHDYYTTLNTSFQS